MTARHAPARHHPSWPFLAAGAVVMFAAGTVAALAAAVAPRVQGAVRGAAVAGDTLSGPVPLAGTVTTSVHPIGTVRPLQPAHRGSGGNVDDIRWLTLVIYRIHWDDYADGGYLAEWPD